MCSTTETIDLNDIEIKTETSKQFLLLFFFHMFYLRFVDCLNISIAPFSYNFNFFCHLLHIISNDDHNQVSHLLKSLFCSIFLRLFQRLSLSSFSINVLLFCFYFQILYKTIHRKRKKNMSSQSEEKKVTKKTTKNVFLTQFEQKNVCSPLSRIHEIRITDLFLFTFSIFMYVFHH